MAAYRASLRQRSLTVLANGLVATLQLEGIDSEFGTHGTSEFDGNLSLAEGAVRTVSELIAGKCLTEADLAKSTAA